MAECRRTRVCSVHAETGADDQTPKAFYAAFGLKHRKRTFLTSVLRRARLETLSNKCLVSRIGSSMTIIIVAGLGMDTTALSHTGIRPSWT